MSWSECQAEHLNTVDESIANTGLMPPLLDNAHSASEIKHVVESVVAAVQHRNPGQLPFLALEVEWIYSDRHIEENSGSIQTDMMKKTPPLCEVFDVEMTVIKNAWRRVEWQCMDHYHQNSLEWPHLG